MLDGYPVQVATDQGLLEFDAAGADVWQPLEQIDVTPGIFEVHRRVAQEPPTEIWRNDTYEVFVFEAESEATHLSIKRYDRAAIRNWRHLQQIKNEVCGEEQEAVEIFPRESRLADNANQLHLWVLPSGEQVPFGFSHGMVTIDPEEVARFNANGDPGRQEPRQEGLTVGDTMAGATALDAQGEAIRQAILDGSLAR
jgi:hypothetical protein